MNNLPRYRCFLGGEGGGGGSAKRVAPQRQAFLASHLLAYIGDVCARDVARELEENFK